MALLSVINMGFVRRNAGSEQFWLAVKQAPIYLDSASGFVTISFEGKPMPAKVQDLNIQFWGRTAAAAAGQLLMMGTGCFSANLGYISIFFSGTSASLAATASLIAYYNWLIGSR